ncbi:MAG: hypothetical protein B7Y41_13655 [Hydrogenophilales bacterium 28-61-23]|nr:MAG: hypothetical protein B7Y41_13655 [Hydrogenophilales bacterium 28-61-23]
MAEIRNTQLSRGLATFGCAVLTISAASPAIGGESYQDWLRGQSQGVAETKQQFEVYRSEQDQQFSGYLKKQWQEFQVFQGKVRDPRPKPKVIPQAPVVVKTPPREPPRATPKPLEVPKPFEAPKPSATPKPVEQPKPAQPPKPAEMPKPLDIPKPAEIPAPKPPVVVAPSVPPVPFPIPAKPAELAADSLELSFYGNVVSLPYDPQWRNIRANKIDPAGLAAYWDKMSVTRIAPTLQAIAKARRDLRLDDWGHATLWQEAAKAILPDRPTEQNLLLWHCLVKAGVDVRLGYSGQEVYLFVAVKQPVYAVSFIKLGKGNAERTYYALLNADRGKGLRTFSTYESNYPAPLQSLDLKGAATGFTKAEPTEKTVKFEYQGRPVQVKLGYDRRLVQYMAGFPQMDFDLYFSTQASPSAREPLLQVLRQRMQGMSPEESVNFLLAFVQKGFDYKTDQDQFGYEKYFFVEEALYYPYSDCEDRSALFSWLVRELVGLKTVGLHYPGHMTTAVAVPNPHGNWSSVDWQGERYVIADPTYINASIGMAMPSYANIKPLRVIPAR